MTELNTAATTTTLVDARALPSVEQAMASLTKTRSTVVGGEAIPDYLREEMPEGLDTVQEVATPPRIRIVQALSNDLKALGFVEGDVVLTPLNVKIGNESTPVDCNVLLTWCDYLALNPRDAANLPWIHDRTIDGKSALAQRCRNRDKEELPGMRGRKGEALYIEFVRALNFLVWLPDHSITATVSFMKGEARYGDAFASLIAARGLAIYSGVYRLNCCEHANKSGDKWKGFTVSNSPTNGGFILQTHVEPLKAMHRHFKALMNSAQLTAAYDEPPVSESTASEVVSEV